MAVQYQNFLSNCFPTIDVEVANYINGILEGGAEDFSSSDELFDAIGDVLQQADLAKVEEEVQEICSRLFDLMKKDDSDVQNGPMKTLDAPIYLGSLAENMVDKSEDHASIWIDRKGNMSLVNQKKLEKAEAKIKQKQEKRANQDTTVKLTSISDSASASQQANRKETKMEASGTNKSYDIRIENFDVAFGDRVLLKGACLVMSYGRRYGLVGRNGIGKTTLLRMIACRDLKIPSHISVLHVEQEVVGDDTLATQSVLESDTKRERLLREEREISSKLLSSSSDTELSSRLATIYQELTAMESDRAPARAAVILAGLGFTPSMQKMCTKEFSGGWRMRLALARALFSKPDLLLLDEPTNMLDMKAIIWLENYLQTWPSTILVVSHDREFLNSVATDILHLQSQQIDGYKGDFEMFAKTRTEKLKNQKKEYEAQKQYRDHIQVFIDRFRYNANRASQVQSKLKLLEKLPPLKPVEKESEVILRLPECDKLSPPILQMDEASFYYSKDKPIFRNVCVSAAMESRICIVGENGAGKTTLLKLLLGDLSPTTGIRHAHRNLRIGYFSQHHVDQMDVNLTSVEVLASVSRGKSVEYYRQRLGAFGVSGELGLRTVASLSGGQKSRVAFALMTLTNPNFFVLDEPTNHLDMETIEALGNALKKFEGGVILVSHDERLIRMICKELWECKDQTINVLEGGIDQYKKIVQTELASQS